MSSIKKCPIPPHSLLQKYSDHGGYADCYQIEVDRLIAFSEFVFAFYTTTLFRIERWILARAVSRPSTDEQAEALAEGLADSFAAWHIEHRSDREILLRDFTGRTRSWLMSVPVGGSRTRLYFGSAVVPRRDPKTDRLSLGLMYESLLGFHRVYSVLLLYSAARRIQHFGGTR